MFELQANDLWGFMQRKTDVLCCCVSKWDLFLEWLKVSLLWPKNPDSPEIVAHTKQIIVSDKYWKILL